MKKFKSTRMKIAAVAAGLTSLVVPVAAAEGPVSAACGYNAGYTSQESFNYDWADSCARIGSNPRVTSEGGYVYWGWQFTYGTNITVNPGLVVVGEASCGDC